MSRLKSALPTLRLLKNARNELFGELLSPLQSMAMIFPPVQACGLGAVLESAPTVVPSQLSFGARGFAVTAGEGGRRSRKSKDGISEESQGLVAANEEFSAITDKIPQRPVSVVEGTSYTLVIIAALGFAAAVIYAALNELIFSPKEYQCFSRTLEKVKDDPRVTVRLGSPVTAYGTESRNRAARQRIPHRIYNDGEGKEHIQLQFHMRGPSGRATVSADMYQSDGKWQYHFLYINVESPVPQQVVLVRPGQPDRY